MAIGGQRYAIGINYIYELCTKLKRLIPKRIVITGAPGTGKTSLIDMLRDQGYHCFPEIIREFTSEEIKNGDPSTFTSNPIVFASDSRAFNRRLITGRVAQFSEASEIKAPIVFFDRGLPDVLAYMDFFEQRYENDFTDVVSKHLYDQVFILPPWYDIYKGDEGRYESFEEAEQLHKHLNETYKAFNYNPVIIPKGSVEERFSFLLNSTEQ